MLISTQCIVILAHKQNFCDEEINNFVLLECKSWFGFLF